MDDKVLTSEQWNNLQQAVRQYDERKDRAPLKQALIPILRGIVESLDDDDDEAAITDRHADDDAALLEKQLVITIIEGELADLTADIGPGWCCRRRRIRPLAESGMHPYSDYLVGLARAKAFDTANAGFIPHQAIRASFGAEMNERKMAELLQFVEPNADGQVNYREFGSLLLVSG